MAWIYGHFFFVVHKFTESQHSAITSTLEEHPYSVSHNCHHKILVSLVSCRPEMRMLTHVVLCFMIIKFRRFSEIGRPARRIYVGLGAILKVHRVQSLGFRAIYG